MSSWRRRLRLLRRYVVFGAASLLILWAVLLGLASQLLPLAAEHPERIAAWLSERAGRPIQFSTSRAYWTRSGPVFVLSELRVGHGENSLRVADAELLLRVYSGLIPGNPLTELRLKGVQLEVVRDASRRWRVTGLGEGGGDLGQIEALGEIRIQDANLHLVDEIQAREFSLKGIALRVRSGGGALRVGGTIPFGQGAPLRLAAEFRPDQGSGSLYLGARDVKLDQQYAELAWHGVALNQASGDVHAWIELQDGEIGRVQTEIDLDLLGLRGVDVVQLDGLQIEPRLGLESLGLSASWQSRGEGGWQADVSRFETVDSGSQASMNGLQLISSPEGVRVLAERLPLQLPARLAGLADVLSPSLRGNLYQAAPTAVASDVSLFWPKGLAPQGHARLDEIGWLGSRDLPGLSGISGQLRGDSAGWLLDIDSASEVVLDWSDGMRQAESLRLSGSLVAFADGEDWQVSSAPLRIEGTDFAIDLSGGMRLPDGGSPVMDLAARLDEIPVSVGQRLIPARRMPPKTVEWLDRSLLGGRVTQAQAAIVGAPQDWPFADAEGRFQALLRGADVVLDYHEDWPRGEDLSAEVTFQNQSMNVEWARARVMGVATRVRSGDIADFTRASMNIDIAAEASGPELLEILRASPLQRRYGAQLAGLSVGGEGSVAVQLFLPFDPDRGKPKVSGAVDLRAADLREARWRLAFDQASGRIRFNESGFAADGLSVRVEGEVAHLDLAVGSYTANAEQAVTGVLRGRLPSTALLDRVNGLDWLKSSVSGIADWQIELAAARDPDVPLVLRLTSNLQGVNINLPEPLAKAAELPRELELGLELPLDQGSINLRLKDIMHLVGRWPESAPFQANIVLGDGQASAPIDQGLHIRGKTEALDALAWVSMGMGGEGGAFSLAELDVQTQRLDLLGRGFTDTRVNLARQDDDKQWRVQLAGEALQGELLIPTGMGPEFPLVGRFQRLHWPQAEGEPMMLDAVRPATLPPIDLRIDDLRYGEAALGSAILDTYPTLEGMHIERFETRSPDLQIDAQGDWNLIGGRERSSFGIRFGGDDLGRMMGALGYDVPVDRGKTEAAIDATWPGAPGAFELERLDGTLRLNVTDGRFLDLEPGAGRILGLFSATEITRRLALDFRDFFETGLAFKSVTGSFTLDGGDAFTEDLDINSPSANISIRGRTGLKALDYDQTVEVLPRTGGVLTVVGALAGGPAGAALGAVAQSVLQKPLGQMSRTLYRLTGSWDEPNTEIIERGPARRGEREREREAREAEARETAEREHAARTSEAERKP